MYVGDSEDKPAETPAETPAEETPAETPAEQPAEEQPVTEEAPKKDDEDVEEAPKKEDAAEGEGEPKKEDEIETVEEPKEEPKVGDYHGDSCQYVFLIWFVRLFDIRLINLYMVLTTTVLHRLTCIFSKFSPHSYKDVR